MMAGLKTNLRHSLPLIVLLALTACGPAAAASTLPPPQVLVVATGNSAPGSAVETAAPDADSGDQFTPTAGIISGAGTPQGAPAAETPAPAATAAPSLWRITEGGCCAQPSWSPDGLSVMFIDRPDNLTPTGLYALPLQGGTPTLLTDRLGVFSPDLSLRAFPRNGLTIVERLADQEQWVIDNGGRAVSFSPDSTRLAWTAGQSNQPQDSASRQVWVSRFDGSQARRVMETTGGGFSGWLPDGRLLVSGRLPAPESGQALWLLTLSDAPEVAPEVKELTRGERLRSFSLSPDGRWLAYIVTFAQPATQSGLWLVDTSTGERRKLEQFGAFRWRGDKLLLIPLDLDQPSHRLLQIDPASGQATPLTDPAATSFKVANGDWSVSPDGRHLVFVSASDRNLWVMALP